jgi:hypothetical protein
VNKQSQQMYKADEKAPKLKNQFKISFETFEFWVKIAAEQNFESILKLKLKSVLPASFRRFRKG